jgi:hypothetical protein
MNQKDKILYLLNYNVSKTTFENTNNFILEQKKWYENPGFEKYAPTDYEKRELKKIDSFSIDPHNFLDLASLVTLFIPLYGPSISTALELTNAYLYLKENKKKSAGLALAFAVIPQLISSKIPIVGKYGLKYFENILLKSTKGEVITKSEREAWDELMKYGKWIKSEATKKILSESFKSVIKRFRFVDIVKLMWLIKKKFPKLHSLSKFVIVVGGISYTWDELADVFGIVDGETKPQSREIIKEYNKKIDKYNNMILNSLDSINTDSTYDERIELSKIISNMNLKTEIDSSMFK